MIELSPLPQENGAPQLVLVTGGTGFVAGWCIVELLERGYQVRATVRSSSKEQPVREAVANRIDPGGRLTFTIADLTSDAGWDAAVAGCDFVLHVASPLGSDHAVKDEDLILPARDGTLRVLKAAARAGVKRVVMTSSCAAASPAGQGREEVIDESTWTDMTDSSLTAYRKSKVLAERAAWDFMASYDGPMTLTTVLPGAIFGPVLTGENPGSVQLLSRLLEGRMPGNPRVGFGIVDVRDLAELHVLAMTAPSAAGERFIASGDFFWMKDISAVLREGLGDRAAKVPTKNLPDFILRLLGIFSPGVRTILPNLGRRYRHSSAKAHRLLGWQMLPAKDTVLDCARSLYEKGVVA